MSAMLSSTIPLAKATRPSRAVPAWQWLLGWTLALLMVGGLIPSDSITVGGITGLSWRVASIVISGICLWTGVNGWRVKRFVLLFMPWITAVSIAGLFSGTSPEEIALDVMRQLFCIAIGAAIFASVGGTTLTKILLVFLSTFAVLTALLSSALVVPDLLHGWSYNSGRDLKTTALQSIGFGVNSVSFAGLVAGVGALRGDNPWRRLVVWCIIILAFDSFVLTARTPLAALVIGAALSWGFAKGRMLWRVGRTWLRSLIFSALIVGIPLVLFLPSIDGIARSSIARELAGRAALWQIAIDSWRAHPLAGTGVRTFTDVIHNNLSAADFSADWERSAVDELRSGGFHNIWVNVLAERGLLGFAGLFVSYTLILALVLRRAATFDETNRLGVLLVFFFMYLRGYFELGGLFSYGDAPIDALAVICLAVNLRPALPPPLRGKRPIGVRSGGRRFAVSQEGAAK